MALQLSADLVNDRIRTNTGKNPVLVPVLNKGVPVAEIYQQDQEMAKTPITIAELEEFFELDLQ